MFGMMSTRSVIRLNPLFQFERKKAEKKKRGKNVKQNHDRINFEDFTGEVNAIAQGNFGSKPKELFSKKNDKGSKRKSWFNREFAKEHAFNETFNKPNTPVDSPSDSNESGFDSVKQYAASHNESSFYYLRKYRRSRNKSRDQGPEGSTSEEEEGHGQRGSYGGFDSIRDYHETPNLVQFVKHQRRSPKHAKDMQYGHPDGMLDIGEEPSGEDTSSICKCRCVRVKLGCCIELPKDGRRMDIFYNIFSCLVFWFCNPIFGGVAFAVAQLSHDEFIIPEEKRRLRTISVALSITGMVTSLIIAAIVLAIYYTRA